MAYRSLVVLPGVHCRNLFRRVSSIRPKHRYPVYYKCERGVCGFSTNGISNAISRKRGFYEVSGAKIDTEELSGITYFVAVDVEYQVLDV